MWCSRCMIVMETGTEYYHDNGKERERRYSQCPKCHDKKFNNQPNFQRYLHRAMSRAK